MRNRTVCFTGHRKMPPEQLKEITRRLKDTITDLIGHGYLYFGAGGALGFDTLAAQTVLELKNTYPQIKLILVLPCETQTRGWEPCDVAAYEEIKAQADKTGTESDNEGLENTNSRVKKFHRLNIAERQECKCTDHRFCRSALLSKNLV